MFAETCARRAALVLGFLAFGMAGCATLLGLEEARCSDCGDESADDDDPTSDEPGPSPSEPDAGAGGGSSQPGAPPTPDGSDPPDASADPEPVVPDPVDAADDDLADDDLADDDLADDDLADDDLADDDVGDDDAADDDDDDDGPDDDLDDDGLDDVEDDDLGPIDVDAGDGKPEAGSPVLSPEELRRLACDEYCDLTMTTCVGADAQYLSIDSCLEVCQQQMRLESELEQPSTNTIDCRVQSARNAAEAGEVQFSCQEAGMMGGGRCGQPCEIYCDSLTRACGGAPGITLPEDCSAVCAGVAVQGGLFSPEITSGNILECRINHLRLATETRQPDAHCPHALGASPCG
jgi:hypothetical protein